MTKNYIIIPLLLLFQTFCAQTITIPDANFKNALINSLCVDTNGDGTFDTDVDTNNDNEIQISEAEAVSRLNVSDKNIAMLEGIEKFTNLELLYCTNNKLTNLDFSQNLEMVNLFCNQNQLTALDVSNNKNIKVLNCFVNKLTSLDISQSKNLEVLYCGFNQLTTLDVSQNSNLISLFCYTNNMTSLNLKNGNNAVLLSMYVQGNSNLTCIEVDDVNLSNNNGNWIKDSTANYSESCGVLSTDDFVSDIEVAFYPNPVKDILHLETPNAVKINAIKVYDAIGRLVIEEKSHLKKLDVSNLSKGVFLVVIETDNHRLTKRIMKK